MAARIYCQVAGVVLLIVGILGVVGFGISGLLSVSEPAEIAFHLVAGALSAFAGFSKGDYGDKAVLYAKVFSIVYLVLGVAGFIMPDLLGLFHFDLACNIVHLALGVYGAYVGYMVKGQTMTESQA